MKVTVTPERKYPEIPESMVRYRNTEIALVYDKPGETVHLADLLRDGSEDLKVVISDGRLSLGIIDGRLIDDQEVLSKSMFKSREEEAKLIDLPGIPVDEVEFPDLEVGKKVTISRKSGSHVAAFSEIQSIAVTNKDLKEDFIGAHLPDGGEYDPFLRFEDLVRAKA